GKLDSAWSDGKDASWNAPRLQAASLRKQCGELAAGDSGDPGNAHEAAHDLHFEDVAGTRHVEIAANHRDALDAMTFAPRNDDDAADREQSGHRDFSDHARFLDLRRRAIERPVAEQQS